MKKILVYGWYEKGNWGDDAFQLCFKELFPQVHFVFRNELISFERKEIDALWIGGGCLLQTPLPEAIYELSQKLPTAIIGVDKPKSIDSRLHKVLAKARIVVFRFDNGIPDLHFALPIPPPAKSRASKTILFHPNAHLVPSARSESWKNECHRWFVHEMAGSLESFVSDGGSVYFHPASRGTWNDLSLAHEIRMRIDQAYRDRLELELQPPEEPTHVCMRLHAAIKCIRSGSVPICISAHDKITQLCKTLEIPFVDYYGFRKKEFFDIIEETGKIPPEKLIEYTKRARSEWQKLSAIIAEKFSL